jgi:hypothetical protein
MWLADAPVALASERVSAEFCRQADGGRAGARDLVSPGRD